MAIASGRQMNSGSLQLRLKLARRARVAVSLIGWGLIGLALIGLTKLGVARADEPTAPTLDYHLENARIELQFDVAQRQVFGQVTHTLAALRDGLHQLDFDSVDLSIGSVSVNGKSAKFSTNSGKL